MDDFATVRQEVCSLIHSRLRHLSYHRGIDIGLLSPVHPTHGANVHFLPIIRGHNIDGNPR